MADQYRDVCVDRQDKKRKEFAGNPVDPIRVSFYDKDGLKVNDVTRSEANCVASKNPGQLFYFQDGNGYQRELLIVDVNLLSIIDALPNAPRCPTNPQLCGPPRVQFFGGMGMGAMANAVISPNSRSIIGFDIVNPGFNYFEPPIANLVDECGYGGGGSLFVQMKPYTGAGSTGADGLATLQNGKGGLEIKNIVITAPGDDYLPAPNGALGGNGRIWKDVDEGYVETAEGTYYVVPSGLEPPDLPPGDTFIPPQPIPDPITLISPIPPVPEIIPTTPISEISPIPPVTPVQPVTPVTPVTPVVTTPPISEPVYPVVTELEEVYVDDPGFGYEPGDTLEVIPDNGAIIEPVINDRGEISEVRVISPGIGFVDLPEIIVNSNNGYNVKLIPVLKVTPLSEISDPTIIPTGTPVISVVDCVGRIPPKQEFDIVPQ